MRFKEYIHNRLLTYLFKSVDVNSVARLNQEGVLYLNGKAITEEEKKSLTEEAKALERMRIWKILSETLKAHAMMTIFEKSTNFDDVKSGKLMLYNLDIQQRIIDTLKQ